MSDISTIFPAHICDHRIQSVDEHCRNVASYAQSYLESVNLRNVAFLAGVLHDAGKYTDSFKQYIEAANNGENVVRGSVNHTFAGVEFIQNRIGSNDNQDLRYVLITKDLIGYAIGSHHGQFDCIDEDGKDGIEYRIHKEDIPYESIWSRFVSNCCDTEELNTVFELAVGEIKDAIDIFLRHCDVLDDRKREHIFRFYLGCLARLISSAVIDGDRCDTASFMRLSSYPKKGEDLPSIWSEQLRYFEAKISLLDKSSTINKARADISEQCRASANEAPAIFRLNVPTGGGKTLSSLRFALAHACIQKKSRIIFVSPLLSILEQNAAVIRDYISDPSLILEHHSNVIQLETRNDELNCNELFTENWSAPIIITTLVQMLNTMFAGKTSSIRRFHALANSVIVIDEVQSVPVNMLSMFNLMITFLNVFCNASIVLCSATQPYLEGTKYPVQTAIKDIIPFKRDLWKVFERTKLINGGSVRFDNLKLRLEELLGDSDSMLVVCNKKTESEFLFNSFSQEYTCFHISAAMCIAHRRKVMCKLKEALLYKGKSPVICFSTQVIEAGVDISFEKVVRLLAGMENAVQAAGRCNRNKEKELNAPVYLIDCSDENLNALTEIKHQKEASRELLYDFKANPEGYENNLASETSIQRYYKNLYRQMDCNYQDFWIKRKTHSLLDLLSVNDKYSQLLGFDNIKHMLTQAFKTAGMEFKVFEDDTIDVIIPYEEGRDIITDLCSEKAKFDLQYRKELLKKARAYTVTIYPYQKNLLEKEKAIIKCSDDMEVWYLLDAYYDCNTGVTLEPNLERYMEV